MPLSFAEQLETTDTVTQFARLYALDRLWTVYLQRAERPISEQDVQVLERVTGEMDELLQAAPASAETLDYAIVEHTEELYASYERILFSEDGLAEDQKMRLRDIATHHRDIFEYGMISARTVMAMAPVERETLAAEMEIIRRGGPMATGDLSKEFGCNLAGGCIIGGLFAPPPMNLVGVGIGLTILLGYEVSGDPC
jgi:hypothetical protein